MSDPRQTLQYHVVYFKPPAAAASPVLKELEKAVRQEKEHLKIETVLESVGRYGWKAPGARFEKVDGSKEKIYELKISAFNTEHRFLFSYAPLPAPDGLPTLVLLKYVKKKKQKLSRTDIETAEDRLRQLG